MPNLTKAELDQLVTDALDDLVRDAFPAIGAIDAEPAFDIFEGIDLDTLK